MSHGLACVGAGGINATNDGGDVEIVSTTDSKQSVDAERADGTLGKSESSGENKQGVKSTTDCGRDSNQVFGNHVPHDSTSDRLCNGTDKKHDDDGAGATPSDNGGWAFDSENPELVLFKLGQGSYFVTIPVHKSDVFQFTSNLLGDLFRINKEAGDWRRAYENQLKQTLLLTKTNSATLKEVYGRLKTVTLQRDEADRQVSARFMKTMEKRSKRLSK